MYMTTLQNNADPLRGHHTSVDSSGAHQAATSSDDRTASSSLQTATCQSAADRIQAFSQAVAAPDGIIP